MLRGLSKLTWLEIKIFVREPLGMFGAILLPVLVFVVLGRVIAGRLSTPSPEVSGLIGVNVPVFAAVLISLSSAVSLITIVSIYREGGILKRLRATPLRPYTILTAHVIVKLLMTAATGNPASTRACMLLPRPEIRTTSNAYAFGPIIASGFTQRSKSCALT